MLRKTNSLNSSVTDGSIEIKEGQVFVKNPPGFGRFPIITSSSNLEIFINGHKIDGSSVVTAEDKIEIQPKDTKPKLDVKVEISKDQMKAFLVIRKEMGQRFKVEDVAPNLEVSPIAKLLLEVGPELPTFEEVIRLLHDNGVVYGVSPDAIYEALANNSSYFKVEVASGLAPSGIIDASIVYNFPMKESLIQPLNPYEQVIIDSVTIGQVLAIKRPAVNGVDGIDVKGNSVKAPPPRDVKILIKEGAKLVHDGMVAVATVTGRPVLEGSRRKAIAVRQVHVVNGDVNMEVGNIQFNGDIFVIGNVLDGFHLEATGSIEVMGDVLCAELSAGRNILIHGKAISSSLKAGGSNVVYRQAGRILSNLESSLSKLIEAISELKNQPRFKTSDLQIKGEGQLIQLLLDLKFKDIPKQIVKLSQVMCASKNEIMKELMDLEKELIQKLCNLGPLRMREKNELETLYERVKKAVETIDQITTNAANITVDYVQNCSLFASGDIIVTGRGCITSNLDAGERILINSGSVRGGQMKASELIKIWEIGSESRVEVNVVLDSTCELIAHHVNPIVVIRYATFTEVLEKKLNNVRCKVGDGGFLDIKYD